MTPMKSLLRPSEPLRLAPIKRFRLYGYAMKLGGCSQKSPRSTKKSISRTFLQSTEKNWTTSVLKFFRNLLITLKSRRRIDQYWGVVNNLIIKSEEAPLGEYAVQWIYDHEQSIDELCQTYSDELETTFQMRFAQLKTLCPKDNPGETNGGSSSVLAH